MRARVKKSCIALMVIGIASAVAGFLTTVSAAKKEPEPPEDATTTDIVWQKVKHYAVPAGLCALSVVFFVLANRVTLKQAAAFAGLYESAQIYLHRYRRATRAAVGEDKETLIHGEASKSYVKHKPPTSSNIIDTGCGETLFYDVLTRQYFLSSIDRIKAIEDAIRGSLAKGKFVSINVFLWLAEVNLMRNGAGEEIGWNPIDKEDMAIGFQPLRLDNGATCIVLTYRVHPHYSYLKPYRHKVA